MYVRYKYIIVIDAANLQVWVSLRPATIKVYGLQSHIQLLMYKTCTAYAGFQLDINFLILCNF